MFKRYVLEVYFIDDIIFRKAFKSINNAIKVASGFDHECNMEVTDLVFDRVITNCELKTLVQEFCSDCEDN